MQTFTRSEIDYMYRVYSSTKDSRIEKGIYRIIGADPKAEQTWGAYARSVLAFSAVSILFLFGFQLVQNHLPLHLNDPAFADALVAALIVLPGLEGAGLGPLLGLVVLLSGAGRTLQNLLDRTDDGRLRAALARTTRDTAGDAARRARGRLPRRSAC